MNGQEFDQLVEERIQKVNSSLVVKAREYANDTDRLHNFNKAGRMSNQSPEKALRGMLLKHLVSVDDIIEKLDQGILPSRALIDEKIGDVINYYILIEACIVDRLNKSTE